MHESSEMSVTKLSSGTVLTCMSIARTAELCIIKNKWEMVVVGITDLAVL